MSFILEWCNVYRECTYTFESTNEFGCTHVSTLNLTINNSSSFEDMTVCDSYDWNGVTYTESGSYMSLASFTADGCDSIACT